MIREITELRYVNVAVLPWCKIYVDCNLDSEPPCIATLQGFNLQYFTLAENN